MLTLITRALSTLPLPLLYRLAGGVHLLLYRVLRLRRAVVESNLARAFPDKSDAEIRELGRRVYRSHSEVLVEMLKAMKMTEADFRERVDFTGDAELEADLQQGQPVLVTLGHQCNLEWMLLATCLRFDFPVESVYRPLSNPGAEKLTTETYTRFGARLIDDRSVVKSILARRREPRLVTMVSDQAPNIRDDVYWTRFLNQETGFYLAPQIIARFTNYPVYFAGMRRRARGRYTVRFTRIAEPPYKDDDKVMPAYVRAVEAQILAAPEDWLWMHRRWKRPRSVYAKAGVAETV